jgi:hypothetical protein
MILIQRCVRIPVLSLILAVGSSSAVPAVGLTNGGFETGDLTGYTRQGFINSAGGPNFGGPTYQTFVNAQTIGTTIPDSNVAESSQTTAFDGNGIAGPAISPTNGNFMGFVSGETSAGDNTLTGSSLLQTFTVPVGATRIDFDLRLLNNDDPNAFVQFDDFGGMALSQGATVLAQYNLDLNPATAANGHVTAGANMGGFVNSTLWASPNFSLVGLGGQNVTLTAYSINYGGDNFVETRLLVDNIRITTVPEPASVVLLLAGFMLSNLLARQRGRRIG